MAEFQKWAAGGIRAVKFLCAVICWLSAVCFAQETSPQFRVDLSLVRVDAQVVTGGRVITGLHKDDFVLVEDGKPQPILYVGVDSDPVDLLLLIDRSGSMQPVVAELLIAAGQTLAIARPADRLAVSVFADEPEQLVAFTPDVEEVMRGLESILQRDNITGATDIDRAVLDAARYMRTQPRTGARRSILVLTDNRAEKTRRVSTVLRELWEADAVLNALIFQSGWERAARTYQHAVSPWGLLLTANVKAYVEGTGGESLLAESPVEAFREMLDRIRKRYTLYYRPPSGPAGKKRSIRVRLSAEASQRHPGATVRARRGYIPVEVIP